MKEIKKRLDIDIDIDNYYDSIKQINWHAKEIWDILIRFIVNLHHSQNSHSFCQPLLWELYHKPIANTQKLHYGPLWAHMCAALSHVLSYSTPNLSISLCQHKLGSIDISNLEDNQFHACMPEAQCIGWVRVGLEFRALRDTQRSSLTRMLFYSIYMSARLYFIQRTSRTRSRKSQEKTIWAKKKIK